MSRRLIAEVPRLMDISRRWPPSRLPWSVRRQAAPVISWRGSRSIVDYAGRSWRPAANPPDKTHRISQGCKPPDTTPQHLVEDVGNTPGTTSGRKITPSPMPSVWMSAMSPANR